MNFFLPIFALASVCLCARNTIPTAAFSKPIPIPKPPVTKVPAREKRFSPGYSSYVSEVYFPSVGSPLALPQLSMAYQMAGHMLPESGLYFMSDEESGNSQ